MDRPDFADLPVTPGVYLYKDAGGRIIYVGKARNLRRRVLSYFRAPERLTPKTVAMISQARSLETLTTTTEKEALLLEAGLIKKHRPRYNILLRDDKQYVLFRLSGKDAFPRLEITRKVHRDGARYFGPFTSGMAARETWKSIHRIFPLRRCTDRAMRNRIKPCLYHHINLCPAPCAGLVTQQDYAGIVQRVALLLAGKSRELLDLLQAGMEGAAETLDFEKAAVLRDQIRAVKKTLERQSVVLQNGDDMDVLGVVTRPDGLALGVIFVRQGMMLDRNTYFWPGLGLEEAGELIWSFLGQFYGPESSIPPRIVVPWLPADSGEPDIGPDSGPDSGMDTRALLEALFGDRRGSSVRIATPRNADEHRLVDMAKSNAREAARSRRDISLSDRLGVILHAPHPLHRIECVDVSHTGGVAAKVGMVVYEDGKPLPAEYRAWNIDGAHGDDYAALSLWATRRLEHGTPWPDLLLVDGGKGQLAAVDKVLRANFAPDVPPFFLAAIAKARDEQGKTDRRAGNTADRIFLPGRANPLPLRPGTAELLFLQAVRDAAHNFALGRHRQARARQAFSGELQRLPGIGPHIAKLLWEHFPSIEAMRRASPDDLAALPGVGKKRAEQLRHSLAAL